MKQEIKSFAADGEDMGMSFILERVLNDFPFGFDLIDPADIPNSSKLQF